MRACRRALLPVLLGAVVVGCQPVPSPSAPAASPTAISLPGSFAFTVQGGNLWAVRGDGSDRRQLTSAAGGFDISPAWAPDASRLAFRHSTGTGGGPGDTDTIRIIGADGSGMRDLIAGSFPAWSPDGGWIAFRGLVGVDLALIKPDGSDLTRLGVRNAECPVWSPDGRQLLYCRNEDLSGVVSDNWEIWVMNRDGSGQRQLTSNPARDYPLAWSADGSRIVFYSQRDGSGASFVMDADGRNVTRVSAATDLVTVGAWLPDGRFVISSAGSGVPDWFVLDENGVRHPLPQLKGAGDPIDWINAP